MRKAEHKGIGLRLKEIRKRAGLTQAAMAAKVGCDQTFISQVERDVSGPSAGLVAGVEALGYSVRWFMRGIGRMMPAASEPESVVRDAAATVRSLPVLGEVPAGRRGLSPVEEVAREHVTIPGSLISDPDAFCLRVHGESMSGVLEEGDLVVVAPNARDKIRNNDLVVIRVEPDAAHVRRWMSDRKRVFLLSANPELPPILLAGDRPVTVIGKVICAIHMYR